MFGTIPSWFVLVIYFYNGRSFNNWNAVNTEIVIYLPLPTIFNGYHCWWLCLFHLWLQNNWRTFVCGLSGDIYRMQIATIILVIIYFMYYYSVSLTVETTCNYITFYYNTIIINTGRVCPRNIFNRILHALLSNQRAR